MNKKITLKSIIDNIYEIFEEYEIYGIDINRNKIKKMIGCKINKLLKSRKDNNK